MESEINFRFTNLEELKTAISSAKNHVQQLADLLQFIERFEPDVQFLKPKPNTTISLSDLDLTNDDMNLIKSTVLQAVIQNPMASSSEIAKELCMAFKNINSFCRLQIKETQCSPTPSILWGVENC